MTEVVLQTKGLTKRYGELTAVSDLSLEVREGEVFGFLGPNGAGKTTSISMMCGLLRPDSGSVSVHGKSIAEGGPDVRARVGVCPQDLVLWERLTCLEQLVFMGRMYGVDGKLAKQRADKLLAELGIADKTSSLANTLSGGMKRRLNIAMALVHDPEIVVLDEPEAGLDPQSRVMIREYIQSLARHKTVIVTTHNMDEADRVADRVAIIDHGELLVLDTPAELKHQVGDGDVVEITLSEPGDDAKERASEALSELATKTDFESERRALTVRALDAVGKLAAILEALDGADFKVGDIRVRENTLEDVFIKLTGRSLRQ